MRNSDKFEQLSARIRKDRSTGRVTWKTTGVFVEYPVMKREEFISIRSELCLTQSKFARVIGSTTRAVQSYEQGVAEVPGPVARMTRLMKSNAIFRAILLQDSLIGKTNIPDLEAISKEFEKANRISGELDALQAKLQETVGHIEEKLRVGREDVRTVLAR